MTEIEQLESELQQYRVAYRNGAPLITDSEYDTKEATLRELAPNSPMLIATDAAEETLEDTIEHSTPMGSLSKVTTLEELKAWMLRCGGHPVYVMPKLDGMSLSLRYKNRKLVQAVTRGNHYRGLDVTANAMVIADIPHVLCANAPADIEIRGEVCMSNSVFAELSEMGLEFANTRNAAAGSIRQNDPEVTRARKLSFIAYQVLGATPPNGTLFADWLHNNGIDIPSVPTLATALTVEDLEAAIKAGDTLRQRMDYRTDGLVFAVAMTNVREGLGVQGLCPRGSIAYKFQAVQATADCYNILWQTGRSGRVTPVLQIAPTLLDGSTVSRVTLHNCRNMLDLELRSDSKVVIEKAGDIIPQVVRAINPEYAKASDGGQRFPVPTTCSSCAAILSSDGVNLWCRNPACPDQLIQRALHHLNVVGVKGIGPVLMADLINAKHVTRLDHLYQLDTAVLKNYTGGIASAQAVVTTLSKVTRMKLSTLLASLGVSGLGPETAKSIAMRYSDNPDKLWNDLYLHGSSILLGDGIAGVTAKSIYDGLAALEKTGECPLLRARFQLLPDSIGGALAGMKICVTGVTATPRNMLQARIESAGGIFKKSVVKDLDYLVCGADVGKVKTKQAEKYGVICINEQALEQLLA